MSQNENFLSAQASIFRLARIFDENKLLNEPDVAFSDEHEFLTKPEFLDMAQSAFLDEP